MTSYNLFLTHFHFVRPFWLLAIILLLVLLWLLKKHQFHRSPWQKFLPPHLSGVLVEGATNSSATTKQPLHERLFLIRPFVIGLLTIIALAGPAWQKLPQPVYQTERGSVLIMDMSYSMYASDIKPNRLTRARFKAVDLLNKINNGDVGLIAYAGDAFVISPLTQDIKNIELLLPSLTPEIMPELGANPYAALTLAHEMLTNAGHLTGDIYWFTDDVDNEELSDIYDWSSKYGHRLNILGIGSANGAPIKLPSGELLKDDKGAIVVPRLPSQKLQSLATRGQGNYQTIRNDDSDIDNLILKFDALDNNKSQQQESQQTGDQWQEQGAWLLLLVLVLALSYFRRGGAILLLPLTCLPLLFLSITVVSPVSYANENAESPPTPSLLQKTWQGLWQTQDQQAQQQFNQENYQSAAQQFKNSQWQGSAHYKAGNYQEALDAFKQGEHSKSANSLYNQGNALAQMKKYEQAIEAYEQALKKNPDLQDAKENLEKLKQQQKKEQEKKDQSQDKESEDDKSEGDKSEDKGDKQKQDNESQQQSQDESDKKQEPQSSEDSANDSKPKDEQQEQSNSESHEEESEGESEQEQEQQAKQGEESPEQGEEKTAAQIAAEQQAKEQTQKHQQLLNKVTDDPYLLLRNKMQLEYQKRRQDGASQGVQKKW